MRRKLIALSLAAAFALVTLLPASATAGGRCCAAQAPPATMGPRCCAA